MQPGAGRRCAGLAGAVGAAGRVLTVGALVVLALGRTVGVRGVADAELLRVARVVVVRVRRVGLLLGLVAAVAEVLGFAVLPVRLCLPLRPAVLLGGLLRRLLPLPMGWRGLLPVRPLLPVRSLLPLLSLLSVLRGAGIPSATHPESSHVLESTWSARIGWRSRRIGAGFASDL